MSETSHISPQQTIGRFAPSPTGPLHLGSLVAAVGSFVMAKREGGRWLLRKEDLDQPRVVPGMADDILRTLEILGLEWDGEIVWQSRREDAYRAALERLIADGVAYPCGCSRAEIARIASAPHQGEEVVYPGTCRNGLPTGKAARAWRVRVPGEEISFNDEIMGRYSEELAVSCGDFVVRRGDGLFAYQLAVVVDDADSRVNQVVRGADLLSSTPRQIFLQEALGLPVPRYAHLPLVTGPDGGKLSKRDNAVSLAAGRDLKKEGSKLVAAALRFLGQLPPPSLDGSGCRQLLEWATKNFNPALVLTSPGTLVLQNNSKNY